MLERQYPPVEEKAPALAELPLGKHLDQSQLDNLKQFALNNFSSLWAGVDTLEELATQVAVYGEGYNPELGAIVLAALGSSIALKGVENDSRQLSIIARDEAAFQAVLVGSVLNGFQSAVRVPDAFRVVAGPDRLNEEIDVIVENDPLNIINQISALSRVLKPEQLRAKVEAAYKLFCSDERANFDWVQLSDELIHVIGRETLSRDIHGALKAGTFQPSFYEIEDIARLGLMTPDEAVELSLKNFKERKGTISAYFFENVATLAKEDGPVVMQKAQGAVLAMIDDTVLSEKMVGELVNAFVIPTSSEDERVFAGVLIDKVKATRGPMALLPVVGSLSAPSQQGLRDEVIAHGLRAFREVSDDKTRGDIASDLIPLLDSFDMQTRQNIISSYAYTHPASFAFNTYLLPSSEKSSDENDFLRNIALKTIDWADAYQVVSLLSDLSSWFDNNDMRFKSASITKLRKMESITSYQANTLKNLLSEDDFKDIFVHIFNATTDAYSLQSTLSAAIEIFGFERAKEIFATQIYSIPDLASGLIANNQMLLSQEELTELIHGVIEAGQIRTVIYDIDHLAYRLPKDEVENILNVAVEQAPRILLERLVVLTHILDEETIRRVVLVAMRQNPAIVLSAFSSLPEGVIQADEIVEYIKADSRTAFASKYFQRITRDLLKAEDTTAFTILAKEAERVYVKLNEIVGGGNSRGIEMLLRIKASIGKRDERAELDALSLATLVSLEAIEPETITTADDARKHAVRFINKKLGAHLDPDAIEVLEQKIGSIVPLSMYALSMNHAGDDSALNYDYLKELVTELEKGDYTTWRYGERAQLIDEGIIPAISPEQYAVWQKSKTTSKSDVVANDATSLARRMQEVVSRGILANTTIEKLANLTDPDKTLDEMKLEIGALGKRISELHAIKKDGGDVEDQVLEYQDQIRQLKLAGNIVKLSRVTTEEIAAGVLFNERGRPTRATIDGVLNEIIQQYGGDALEAFEQLFTMLDNYRSAATTDIGNIRTSDVDDFQTTFEIGASPVGSCQHYELGQFNGGLLGYFEPGVKIITVKNENDKFVARAACRLAWDGEEQPVMVLEPVYMSQASNDIEGAIIAHAKAKADDMGVRLFVRGHGGRRDIRINGQRAPQLYSDIFGGLRDKSSKEPAIAKDGLVLVE